MYILFLSIPAPVAPARLCLHPGEKKTLKCSLGSGEMARPFRAHTVPAEHLSATARPQ